MATNWRTLAQTDPAVKAWYGALQKRDPRLANVPVTDYMLNEPSGYDYPVALEEGIRPSMTEHGDMRWISDNPNYWKGAQATKLYEGFSPTIYKDTKGNPTTGYGFNLNDSMTKAMLPVEVATGMRPITQAEADAIFSKRYQEAVKDAVRYAGPDIFSSLNSRQKSILADMAYNLGSTKLGEFVKLKAALKKGDISAASREIKDSDWYKQTKRRGKHHAAQFGRND